MKREYPCEICDSFECTCWCDGCGLLDSQCCCDMTEQDWKDWDKQLKELDNK